MGENHPQKWKVRQLWGGGDPGVFLNVLVCLVLCFQYPSGVWGPSWEAAGGLAWPGSRPVCWGGYSFPMGWQADGTRAGTSKNSWTREGRRGRRARPLLPRKLGYHPSFLSDPPPTSHQPLTQLPIHLPHPMTSLPSPITGVLIWALLEFYPEEEARGERRGLCRWGGGRRVRGAGWGPSGAPRCSPGSQRGDGRGG